MTELEMGRGRYRLIRRIGAGGIGTVYQAVDLLLGRTVAIKALHDAGAGELLRAEARALATLSHAHIIALHDLLEEDGHVYLVMEHVDGCSLDRWLVQNGPLGMDAALRIFRQTADAVRQAHRHGIIHCDLKPANVLVSTAGTVKLTDFTLARSLDAGRFAGRAGGSGHYAAPEQLGGAEVDLRADVYGLGMLLRDMINVVELAAAPAAQIATVIERATALSPEERYATVDELLAALPVPEGSSTELAPLSPLPELTRVAPGTGQSVYLAPRWPLAALAAALVVALAGVLTHFPVTASAARVTVPDLVAAQAGSAQLIARSLALRVRTVPEFSASAPAGTVIAQRPGAGSTAPVAGTITLIVSKGPRPVPVPDLTGLSERDALQRLHGLGLQVVTYKQDTISHSSGQVLSQSPAPGMMRIPGTRVVLTVSQKPWWWPF